MAWQPLLEGGARDRALAIVRDILADVDRADVRSPDLAGGAAGLALLHAYAEQAGLGGGERADTLLAQAIDAVAETPLGATLYSGFSGIAWVADHMTGAGADVEAEDPNADIDDALLEHLGVVPWTLDYDLIVGLVGYGVYALDRALRPGGRRCLERTIDRLGETAVEVAGSPGVTWWTGPHLMIPETRAANPQGYYNTGLAHGVPGVIALLGEAVAAGVAVEKARPLLERSVAWLLSHRGEAEGGAQFPYTVAIPPEAERHPVRAAWCYGDPGIAIALLVAARSAREPAWERVALDVARRVATRPVERCGVIDGGLCHGAAGLMHIYNRLYRATGEPVFADAARVWAERLFDLRKPGEGIGGYLAWAPAAREGGEPRAMTWLPEAGVLTGSAGIALALLGVATEHEPRWDHFLLTSVPPR